MRNTARGKSAVRFLIIFYLSLTREETVGHYQKFLLNFYILKRGLRGELYSCTQWNLCFSLNMCQHVMCCLAGNVISKYNTAHQSAGSFVCPKLMSRPPSVCEDPFQKKRLNVRFECFVWLLCRKQGKTSRHKWGMIDWITIFLLQHKIVKQLLW